jgi:hypothetical protein
MHLYSEYSNTKFQGELRKAGWSWRFTLWCYRSASGSSEEWGDSASVSWPTSSWSWMTFGKAAGVQVKIQIPLTFLQMRQQRVGTSYLFQSVRWSHIHWNGSFSQARHQVNPFPHTKTIWGTKENNSQSHNDSKTKGNILWDQKP